MVNGSTTSQRMFNVASSKKGSITALSVSGIKIMSDSSMLFQPAIDEPSNIFPSLSISLSTTLAGTVTCCSFPMVSQKRRSTNLTSCSLISLSTLSDDIFKSPQSIFFINQLPLISSLICQNRCN